MSAPISSVFDEALRHYETGRDGDRRRAEIASAPYVEPIRLSAHVAEEHVRGVWTYMDGIVEQATPTQFVDAWMRWQNSRKGGVAYTVFNDRKIWQAAGTFIAARQHDLVASTGVGPRRRICLTHPTEQVFERGSKGTSRIVARSMLTPEQYAVLEADRRRRAARQVQADIRYAERIRPLLVERLTDLADMADRRAFDGIIPSEWIKTGYVPDTMSGRTIRSSLPFLCDLHTYWPAERVSGWLGLLSRHANRHWRFLQGIDETPYRRPVDVVPEVVPIDLPDDDGDVLGALA